MKKMKPYKGYTATVEFDADEMVLHGRVDNIRDVVTFHASSVEQLQPAFVEAVDDYIDLCTERGEQPDRPFSGKFVLRIDPDLHRQAASRAALESKSLNTWIAEAISAVLSRGALKLDAGQTDPVTFLYLTPEPLQNARLSATYRVKVSRASAPDLDMHKELLKFSKFGEHAGGSNPREGGPE